MIKFIYAYIINPFIKRFPEISIPIKELPDAEFDIEDEAIFAIEREDDTTIIGFYPKDGTNNIEWSMTTNLKCHDDFIKRFKEKLSIESTECI